MSKDILFRPLSKEAQLLVDKPKPAKSYFPQWYKDVPKMEPPLPNTDQVMYQPTMKSCMPFFDSFTAGYIQETWCDLYIDSTKGQLTWRYPMEPAIVGSRQARNHYPKIEGFSEHEIAWRQMWIPQLPKGYSMIYTHPFNRYDLPFLSLTGIIDNDTYYMENLANHPFFVREDFVGIIPKGTPMFQMIPIKRDSWVSKFGEYDEDLKTRFQDLRKFFTDGYRKLYWNKKEYL